MNTPRRLFAVGLLVVSPCCALAQAPPAWGPPRVASLPNVEAVAPAGALTLEELEQMAAANNPTLARASAEVRAAQGKWVQEGLYPNPTLAYVGDEIGN